MRIWNVIFLVGFVVFCGIRGTFKRRTKGNEMVVRRADGLEKALLVLLTPGMLVLPLLYLFTPCLAFADYHLPVAAMYCGTALMLFSLWVFWRSHADLGQNWSQTLELRKGHQLVKHGFPFRFISLTLSRVDDTRGFRHIANRPNILSKFSPLHIRQSGATVRFSYA